MKDIASLITKLTHSEEDIFDTTKLTFSTITGRGNEKLIIAYGAKDSRRNIDAVEECFFCNFKECHPDKIYKIGSESEVMIDGIKALQYSKRCISEPGLGIFKDFMKLAYDLKGHQVITVVNLPGSGASTPQHFHTQIFPMQYIKNKKKKGNSIKQLLNNFKYNNEICINKNKNIRLREIVYPFWGFETIFPEDYLPEKVGEDLFNVLQQEIRLSQRNISYNLYINSENPNIIKIIFKEEKKETPFSLDEIYELVVRTKDQEYAKIILNSDNVKWRWGWLETIGGLPARDSSFEDIKTFNFNFWNKVYEKLSISKEHMRRIQTQLICSLGYPRVAVYLLLSQDADVYEDVTKLIGYDIHRCQDLKKESCDEYIEKHTEGEVKYGCHITLIDTFTPCCAIGDIYKTLEPIIAEKGFKNGLYMSGKKLSPLKGIQSCLIMQFGLQESNIIKDLHKSVLAAIQPCRVNMIEPEFIEMKERSESLAQFGAPYVDDDYCPHLTVVSGIKKGKFDTINEYLEDNYSGLLHNNFSIDSICIVREANNGLRWGIEKKIKIDN